MRRWIAWFLALVFLAPAGARSAVAGEMIGEVRVPPGAALQSYPLGEGKGRYVLFEPAECAERLAEDPKTVWPVVLLLSRGDQAPLSEPLLRLWLELAAEHRFILAWSPVDGLPAHQTVDLQRVLGVLEDVERKTAADRGRVILAGFGHGACAAWDAAMRQPERFRALVSVNGISARQLYAPCVQVSAYLVQGERARLPVAIEQGREVHAALEAMRAAHVWREVKGAADEVAGYAAEMRHAAAWLAGLKPREGEGRTCGEILAARHAQVRVRSARERGMTPGEVQAVLGPAQGRGDAGGEPPQYTLIWSRDLARKNLYAVIFETRGSGDEAVRTFVQEQDKPLPPVAPGAQGAQGAQKPDAPPVPKPDAPPAAE